MSRRSLYDRQHVVFEMDAKVYEGNRVYDSRSDKTKSFPPSRSRLLRYVPLAESYLVKLFDEKKIHATIRVCVKDEENIFRVKLVPDNWPISTVGYGKFRNTKFVLENENHWNRSLYYMFYYEPPFALENDVVFESENDKPKKNSKEDDEEVNSDREDGSKSSLPEPRKYTIVLNFVNESSRVYNAGRYSDEIRTSGERSYTSAANVQHRDRYERNERDYHRDERSSNDDRGRSDSDRGRGSFKESDNRKKRQKERYESPSLSESESSNESDSESDVKRESSKKRKRSHSQKRKSNKRRDSYDDDDDENDRNDERDTRDRDSAKVYKRKIQDRVHDPKDDSFHTSEYSDFRRK